MIIGLQHAILLALIASFLCIVLYIGNIIGGGLAILIALMTNGGLGPVIGIVVIISVAQFVESYILEPLIVGDRVDLNPVFTIIAVVLGGAVWGIPGMILAIPYLGILKVIFDNVEELKPFGFLIGKSRSQPGKFDQIKEWFREKLS